MKTVDVFKKNWILHIFFIDFFHFFKTTFCHVPIHLDNFYISYNVFGVFSYPEQFFSSLNFLSSLYQKKVCAVRSFLPQNQSKLVNQTG